MVKLSDKEQKYIQNAWNIQLLDKKGPAPAHPGSDPKRALHSSIRLLSNVKAYDLDNNIVKTSGEKVMRNNPVKKILEKLI